jgi:hypothetical protein
MNQEATMRQSASDDVSSITMVQRQKEYLYCMYIITASTSGVGQTKGGVLGFWGVFVLCRRQGALLLICEFGGVFVQLFLAGWID